MARGRLALAAGGVTLLLLAWAVLRGDEPSRPGATLASAAAAAPVAVRSSADPLAKSIALCARGADPLLTGQTDPEFASFAGNPAVVARLTPACSAVAAAHPDPNTRAAADAVLGRAALAIGSDSEWHLRRAESTAPEALPVRLLRLQNDLAFAEASYRVFNDVAPLRAALAALGRALPDSARTALAARIARAELHGEWNDVAVVRLAVFGTAPAFPVERDARLSFMRGVTDACQSAGFRPNGEQDEATGVQSLGDTAQARLMKLRQYSDGTKVGRALGCGGTELTAAYTRIATPLIDSEAPVGGFLDLTETAQP